MESFEKYFTEMALTDFQKIGKWDDKKNRHGYDKASMGILNSDAGVKKIQDTFNRIDLADFALYFLKKSGIRDHSETGMIDPSQLQQKLGLTYGKDIPEHEDAITIIFVNNRAADRTPLTPWTIAHRIGHSFDATDRKTGNAYEYRDFENRLNRTLQELFRDVYGYTVKTDYGRPAYSADSTVVRNLFESIGTFRSARMKKLNRPREFLFECFAQYLLSNGNLTFNDLPDTIATSNQKAWGKPTGGSLRIKDRPAGSEYKQQLIYLLQNEFDRWIGSHINSISIM